MDCEVIDRFGDVICQVPDVIAHIPDAIGHISDVIDHIPDVIGHIFDVIDHIPDVTGHISDAVDRIPNVVGHISDVIGHISDVIDQIPEPEAVPRRGLGHASLARPSTKGKMIMAEIVVPSPHTEQAKALVEKIRALRDEIPRFTLEAPGDARTLAAAASLSESFIESASASLPKSTMLGNAPNAATLRDSFAFAVALETAVTEANAFARAMEHTVRVAKATAGASALDIYAFAQRLARRKDGAELVPHVEDMRRKLKRGRRKATSEPASDASVKVTPKP